MDRDEFRPGLKSFLHPGDVGDFLQHYWPHRPFVVHGPVERFGRIASDSTLTDLPRLLTLEHSFRRSDLRRGEKLFSVEDPSPTEALNLYESGFTLYLFNVRSAAFVEWQQKLCEELGLPPGSVIFTLFASRPGAGTSAHFDAQENFIVQVRGVKRWRIAPNKHVQQPSDKYVAGSVPSPVLRYQAAPDLPTRMPGEGEETVELRPGSVLFLPRGYWHETDTAEDSLHWTVQAQTPRWSECLDFLLKNTFLMHDPEWRSPVLNQWRSGAPDPDLLRELARRLRRLSDRLESASLEQLLGGAASVNEQVQNEISRALRETRPALESPGEH